MFFFPNLQLAINILLWQQLIQGIEVSKRLRQRNVLESCIEDTDPPLWIHFQLIDIRNTIHTRGGAVSRAISSLARSSTRSKSRHLVSKVEILLMRCCFMMSLRSSCATMSLHGAWSKSTTPWHIDNDNMYAISKCTRRSNVIQLVSKHCRQWNSIRGCVSWKESSRMYVFDNVLLLTRQKLNLDVVHHHLGILCKDVKSSRWYGARGGPAAIATHWHTYIHTHTHTHMHTHPLLAAQQLLKYNSSKV